MITRSQAAVGFDQAARDYDATGTEFFGDMGKLLVDMAGVFPGARVLDVGCGKGAATVPAALAAGPDGQVTGLDSSQAMLGHARAAVSRFQAGNVTLLEGDALSPPVQPGSLDVVMASSVIQFLDGPREAARAWLPLLVPGGTLAVSWGMKQDPAWLPVMAVLDDAVPAPAQGIEAILRRPPFDGPDGVNHMLSGLGYADAVTRTEMVTTEYEGPEQWWQACLGQAPWAVSWRHIPAPALQDARARAFRILEGLRDGAGRLHRTLGFGYTTARRPGGPQD